VSSFSQADAVNALVNVRASLFGNQSATLLVNVRATPFIT
jgi:hypothetical protein